MNGRTGEARGKGTGLGWGGKKLRRGVGEVSVWVGCDRKAGSGGSTLGGSSPHARIVSAHHSHMAGTAWGPWGVAWDAAVCGAAAAAANVVERGGRTSADGTE